MGVAGRTASPPEMVPELMTLAVSPAKDPFVPPVEGAELITVAVVTGEDRAVARDGAEIGHRHGVAAVVPPFVPEMLPNWSRCA